jgi:hypothetical protein
VSKVKELEKRLQVEPDNLGLRVMLAGAMREAGRLAEAVELYRSVAIMYRDQGRTQQAIAVCRSILDLAPDDVRCHALLAMLVAGKPEDPRPSTSSEARAIGRGTGAPANVEVRAKTADEIPPEQEIPTLRPRPASATPAPIPTIARSAPAAPPDRAPIGARSAPPAPPERARPKTAPPPPAMPEPPPRASETGPKRRSSFDDTPLPRPLPYHIADPTTQSLKKLSAPDLPVAENAPTRPGSERTLPELTGIANAARRISASLIAATRDAEEVAIEVDLGPPPRPSEGHPTTPMERLDLDDELPTPPPPEPPPLLRDSDPDPVFPMPRDRERDRDPPLHRDSEEEQTQPRDLPLARSRRRTPPPGPLGTAFFQPLPLERRAAVLSRFHRRPLAAGTTVIRQGEQGHALVLVAAGRLEVRVERPDGTFVQLGAIAPGEYVGEAALLARQPAPAHVIALTDVELLLLQPRDFYEIAGAYPALWAELKDVAERRTREHDARLKR